MRNPDQLTTAVKWAVTIIVPSALMFFLFSKTNINWLVVMVLAGALCGGLLFIFRLITVPGTKEEIAILQESTILNQTGKLIKEIVQEARITKRYNLLEEAQELEGITMELVAKMRTDPLVTLQVPTQINHHLEQMLVSLKTCNQLTSRMVENKEVNNRLNEITNSILPRTTEVLKLILEEYTQGRLLAVDAKLRSLEGLFSLFDVTGGSSHE